MNEKELQEIKERCEKATPGPWAGDYDDRPHVAHQVMDSEDLTVCFMAITSYDDSEQDIFDTDFIAHAREDIPALLAEIERLRSEHGIMYDALAKICQYESAEGNIADEALEALK